jgi:hypothetical protein
VKYGFHVVGVHIDHGVSLSATEKKLLPVTLISRCIVSVFNFSLNIILVFTFHIRVFDADISVGH